MQTTMELARGTKLASNHRKPLLIAASPAWQSGSAGRLHGSTASLRRRVCHPIPRPSHSQRASASASPRPLPEPLGSPSFGVGTAQEASATEYAAEPRGGTQPAQQNSRGNAVTQVSGRAHEGNGPGSSEQQRGAARAFVSWWDRLTRLCVAASALLLAAGMVADLRANAVALAHLAAGGAAILPTWSVRCLGLPPQSSQIKAQRIFSS